MAFEEATEFLQIGQLRILSATLDKLRAVLFDIPMSTKVQEPSIEGL